MVEFPKIIQADGFTLEKVKPTFDTAKYLFELVDRQREYLAKWLEWVDFSNCPEDMYPHLLKSSETKSSNYYIVQDNKIIGSISFVVFSEKHKMAEIGYWLSKDYNGRGIMTRAVKALESFGFETFNLNRIGITADSENLKSCAVAERAGYIKEGVLRQANILRGLPRDIAVYSKLKSEWEKENKNA